MSDNAGTTPGGLTDILRALPGNKLMHPSMESYLVLQTSRLQAGQEPIDSVIDGSYYWSWLEGKFTVGQSGHAPAGCWGPDDGQVSLNRDRVGYHDDFSVCVRRGAKILTLYIYNRIVFLLWQMQST